MNSSHIGEGVALPDFRNLGVVLRCLIIAEAASLAALVVYSQDGFAALLDISGFGLIFESSLLCVVLILFIVAPWLGMMQYRAGVWVVVVLSATVAMALDGVVRVLIGPSVSGGAGRAGFVAALLSGVILAYFNWRQRVLSPAVAESRLIALQSRIRPHFLFNSLNTAVSLIREEPRLAEQVLLDMAELFRVLVAEKRALVPLGEEISLARSYVDIEQLRLGARLRVFWDCGDVPLDAPMPLLVLQPVLENAVRYGIEPAEYGGDIHICAQQRHRRLEIEVRNSIPPSSSDVPSGNRIALENIRERLALHFDSEAELRTQCKEEQFIVTVSIPLRIKHT